ncbi:MAG: glycosyltransferase family 4 protein [Nitrospinales bacterium]
MKIKVVIIQGYNTPYRNELFNLISDYGDIDLTLLYISKRGLDKKWKDDLQARFKEVQVKCKVRHDSYLDRNTKMNYMDFLRKILKLNPDVIIYSLNKYTILINYALFWRKLRLVHWSEATMVKNRGINCFKKPYLKRQIKLPKAFLFPGKMAREYHEYCGFNVNDILFYAPNSVDDKYAITANELENKFSNVKPLKFLFVGSFVKAKGFDLLNAVFVRLIKYRSNFELHVAGDGPIEPTDGIVNHGFLSKIELIRLYKKCHVFIMPSIADCNPLSLIEAAKTGNAILASRGVGNHPEYVSGNGYIFEIGNEEDLFNHCRKIMVTGKGDLLKMAKRSIELVSGITHKKTAASFYKAIKYVTRQR